MKRSLIMMIVAFACLYAAPARAGSYGTELPFVLGTSARASAMGVSGLSLTGDATIQYYNPAILSDLQWKEFSFYRSSLFESGAAYHAVSYAQPLMSNGTLAVSFMRLDVGGVEERSSTNELLSTDLHNAQTRVLIGVGRKVASGISAGFNIVFDNQSFGDYGGAGVGLDVGLSAQQVVPHSSWLRGVREGFVVRNVIEPAVKLDQERVADPTQLGFGLSVLSEVRDVFMETSINLTNPKFSPAALHVGQEFIYRDNYSLRLGVDEDTPTYGFGARYKNVALDYAFRSEDIGNNHRISLAVRWGPSLSERQAADRVRTEHEINSQISQRMETLEKQQIDRSLARGKELLAESSYTDALNYFEATLLWDPANEEARALSVQCRYLHAMNLGKDTVARGDYAGALVYLREALRVVPEDTEATDLIKRCNQHIASSQNSAAAVNRLLKTAIDLYADRRFSEALGGFEEVLEIEAGNALAKEYRAKCAANIRSAVEGHRRNAKQFAERGDYEKAIQELRAALVFGSDPILRKDVVKYTELFNEQKHKEDPDPIPDSTDPVVISGSDLAHLEKSYRAGISYFEKGDFKRAIAGLSDVWAVDPQFHNVSQLLSKAYLFVGMNYYAEQNYTQAITMWEKALTVDPTNTKAERYLRKASEEARKLGGVNSGN